MPDVASLTTIKSDGLEADIHPLGAQLYGLRDTAARDLLWDGDSAIWSGRAPLLFPIVGTLAGGKYNIAGVDYSLPRHGFARNKPFELKDVTPSTALFRLQYDDATMAVYPFQFELDVRYSLLDLTLSVEASIKNLGTCEMPASFGFHPAIRWPLPYGSDRADHAIIFEKEEPAPIRRLDSSGVIIPAGLPSPVRGRVLILRDELFNDDVIIFDRIQSRRLVYEATQGPSIQMDFPDTPFLGVWTKPGAPFICIEPWHGLSDPKGFNEDFRVKPGIFSVSPGQEKRCTTAITLRNPV